MAPAFPQPFRKRGATARAAGGPPPPIGQIQRTGAGHAPLVHGLQRPLQGVGTVGKIVVHGHDHRQIRSVTEADLVVGTQVDERGDAARHAPGLDGGEQALEAGQLVLLGLIHRQGRAHRGRQWRQAQHLRLPLGQGSVAPLQQLAPRVQQPILAAGAERRHRVALGHLDEQGIGQLAMDGHLVHIGQLRIDLPGNLVFVQGEQVIPLFHPGGLDHLRLGIPAVAGDHYRIDPEKHHAAHQKSGEDEQGGQQLIEEAEASPVPPPSMPVPSRRHAPGLLFCFSFVCQYIIGRSRNR